MVTTMDFHAVNPALILVDISVMEIKKNNGIEKKCSCSAEKKFALQVVTANDWGRRRSVRWCVSCVDVMFVL